MSTKQTYTDLIPAHLQPKSDELLSSWLVRLALAYRMPPNKFYSLLLPQHPIFPTYVDETDNVFLSARLEDAIGVSEARVKATTLTTYESVFVTYHSRGRLGERTVLLQWILPISHQHSPYNLYGLQYCPSCLSEDEAPYFRRRWRLAFISMCEIHHVLLLDSCERCGLPIDFRRNASEGQKKKRRTFATTKCYSCNFDVRDASTTAPPQSTFADDLSFQETMLKVLGKREIITPKGENYLVDSLFDRLYSLTELLAFGESGRFIRTQLCKRYDLRTFSVTQTQGHRSVETLRVRERFRLIRVAGRAMREWPDDLLHFRPHYKPRLPDPLLVEASFQ